MTRFAWKGIGRALFTSLEQKETLVGMTALWVPRSRLQPNTLIFNLVGTDILFY